MSFLFINFSWKIDGGRWRARFRTYYEGKNNFELYSELMPTPQEYEAYKEAHPDESAKIQKLKNCTTFTRTYRTFVYPASLPVTCKHRSTDFFLSRSSIQWLRKQRNSLRYRDYDNSQHLASCAMDAYQAIYCHHWFHQPSFVLRRVQPSKFY